LVDIVDVLEKRAETMKLRDLFLPKIARSDPEVRKQAVLKEDNKELLMNVIENDSDEEVCQTARQRLQALDA
jgi:DNA-directed RNA polymerase subunit H (RpoH/RPB5)